MWTSKTLQTSGEDRQTQIRAKICFKALLCLMFFVRIVMVKSYIALLSPVDSVFKDLRFGLLLQLVIEIVLV